MATHPVVDDEAMVPGDSGAPPPANPTQLPVEPEFGQALPPAEPEVPGVITPKI